MQLLVTNYARERDFQGKGVDVLNFQKYSQNWTYSWKGKLSQNFINFLKNGSWPHFILLCHLATCVCDEEKYYLEHAKQCGLFNFYIDFVHQILHHRAQIALTPIEF